MELSWNDGQLLTNFSSYARYVPFIGLSMLCVLQGCSQLDFGGGLNIQHDSEHLLSMRSQVVQTQEGSIIIVM